MKQQIIFSESSGQLEYPLLIGQKSLWQLHQLGRFNGRYHMPFTFKFKNILRESTFSKFSSVIKQRLTENKVLQTLVKPTDTVEEME